MLGSLLLPRLADIAGPPARLLAGAGGMLLLAGVSLGLRVRPDEAGWSDRRTQMSGVPG